jgi:hypothetical protein
MPIAVATEEGEPASSHAEKTDKMRPNISDYGPKKEK